MNFIAFPGLGIKWFIDPVAFSFGPFTVRWYGIMLSLAIFSALWLSLRQSSKYGIKSDHMVDMFMFALPVSVIFARVFFVIVEWDSFRHDIWGAFRIWEGGITIYGAVFGGALTVVVYTWIKKFKAWDWIDFACVYLPFAQAIGRYGNFFNQELYGGNTTLPWGMTGSLIQAFPNPGVNGNLPVHPTFLYESLWNILVFIILMNFRPRSKKRGQVFAAYLFLYSIGRFGMELIRTDVFSFEGSTLRANMIVAVVIAALGILLFVIRQFSADKLWIPLPAEEAENAADKQADKDDKKAKALKKRKDDDIDELAIPGQSAYGNVLKALQEKEDLNSSSDSDANTQLTHSNDVDDEEPVVTITDTEKAVIERADEDRTD